MSLTIESIQQDENNLKLPNFDDEVVFELGLAARTYARANHPNDSVVIDITTVGGATVFRSYIGQIQPDNEYWVKKKRNTVIRFESASKRFGLSLEEKGRTFEDRGLNNIDYTNYGGGFPIRLQSAPDFVFAVLTVSGLKDYEDHNVCVEALKAVLNK
jgi:uncharacterized protein (UPF0303 family)